MVPMLVNNRPAGTSAAASYDREEMVAVNVFTGRSADWCGIRLPAALCGHTNLWPVGDKLIHLQALSVTRPNYESTRAQAQRPEINRLLRCY
jgi:hypothetical protein